MEVPILKFPNMENEFFVEMDAFSIEIGAILTQFFEAEDSKSWFPILFASRSLNKVEQNYSTTEREGLAVV